MDVAATLKVLYQERELIDQAILALERAAADAYGKRRGRPPKWLQNIRQQKPREQQPAKPANQKPANKES